MHFRPHLARRPDGAVVLIEGRRCRAVESQQVREALQRTLGEPEDGVDRELELRGTASELPVELVMPPDLKTLAERAPTDASIALVGASLRADRTVQRFPINDADRDGARALDRLALARARGVTHLLVPEAAKGWLARSSVLADHLARRATIVATNNAGALWRLPAPPSAGAAKVFGIGLSKTGTLSLHLACEMLGLRSLHWGDRRSYLAVLEAQRDGERLLHHVGEQFDVYSDIETLSERFDLADLQYPGSRFILTVRDVDGWIDSRRRHVERNRRDQSAGIYGGVHTRVDEDKWRARWQAHVDRVTAYFENRDDLLVLDIGAGNGWEQLAPFLGRPVPAAPFPHGNRHTRLGAAWRALKRRLPARVAQTISIPAKRARRVRPSP